MTFGTVKAKLKLLTGRAQLHMQRKGTRLMLLSTQAANQAGRSHTVPNTWSSTLQNQHRQGADHTVASDHLACLGTSLSVVELCQSSQSVY